MICDDQRQQQPDNVALPSRPRTTSPTSRSPAPSARATASPTTSGWCSAFSTRYCPRRAVRTLVLAEDGICGPKTQAAINKYQKFAVGFVDGRIDPQGKTIRALTGFIVGSPTVPQGILGQNAAGQPAKDTPNAKVPPPTEAEKAIADAQQILRELEPRLNLLRSKLTPVTPPMQGLLDKHFAAGNDRVKPGDIVHVSNVLANIHFSVARAIAPGLLPVDNMLLFDEFAEPGDIPAYTVFGGDKLSTNEFVILIDHFSKKPKKFHGQTIWLTRLYYGHDHAKEPAPARPPARILPLRRPEGRVPWPVGRHRFYQGSKVRRSGQAPALAQRRHTGAVLPRVVRGPRERVQPPQTRQPDPFQQVPARQRRNGRDRSRELGGMTKWCWLFQVGLHPVVGERSTLAKIRGASTPAVRAAMGGPPDTKGQLKCNLTYIETRPTQATTSPRRPALACRRTSTRLIGR